MAIASRYFAFLPSFPTEPLGVTFIVVSTFSQMALLAAIVGLLTIPFFAIANQSAPTIARLDCLHWGDHPFHRYRRLRPVSISHQCYGARSYFGRANRQLPTRHLVDGDRWCNRLPRRAMGTAGRAIAYTLSPPAQSR